MKSKSKSFICTEYDPATGRCTKLWLVLAAEEEWTANIKAGDEIVVNGKTYVLGAREFDKRSIIATYELVVRPTSLAL